MGPDSAFKRLQQDSNLREHCPTGIDLYSPPTSMSPLPTSIAGVSRVSPVSFLNANPSIVIFLPRMVLNKA
jgi:hypothetical protein